MCLAAASHQQNGACFSAINLSALLREFLPDACQSSHNLAAESRIHFHCLEVSLTSQIRLQYAAERRGHWRVECHPALVFLNIGRPSRIL